MPKLTAESFLSVLRQSGLVEKDQLKRLIDDLQQAGGNTQDSDAIAAYLIQREVITQWQSDKLQQGKHKGFTLGKYKLLRLLGKGGMSSVYLAEHVLMRRRCAIKVLPIKRVKDSSYLARFHREAQAVASLDHPNIVRAYDIDHEIDKDTEIHFLVMEYVNGRSVQDVIKEDGKLSVEDTAEYIRQAALGLEHAHQAGLVHRDVKPGNLLVDTNGVVKLLDLGLARFATTDEENPLTVTHDEKVLGTADYLSPEQALDSHMVDARADIYSLGCTIYYCLTAHPPFVEGTLAQRLMWHQTKAPPPISVDRPDVPESFTSIVTKMMAKKADDRFQTMADVADALANWLELYASPEWRAAHPGSTVSGTGSGSNLKRAASAASAAIAAAAAPVVVPTAPAIAPLANVAAIPDPPTELEQSSGTGEFFRQMQQGAVARAAVATPMAPSATPVPVAPAPEMGGSNIFDFGNQRPAPSASGGLAETLSFTTASSAAGASVVPGQPAFAPAPMMAAAPTAPAAPVAAISMPAQAMPVQPMQQPMPPSYATQPAAPVAMAAAPNYGAPQPGYAPPAPVYATAPAAPAAPVAAPMPPQNFAQPVPPAPAAPVNQATYAAPVMAAAPMASAPTGYAAPVQAAPAQPAAPVQAMPTAAPIQATAAQARPMAAAPVAAAMPAQPVFQQPAAQTPPAMGMAAPVANYGQPASQPGWNPNQPQVAAAAQPVANQAYAAPVSAQLAPQPGMTTYGTAAGVPAVPVAPQSPANYGAPPAAAYVAPQPAAPAAFPWAGEDNDDTVESEYSPFETPTLVEQPTLLEQPTQMEQPGWNQAAPAAPAAAYPVAAAMPGQPYPGQPLPAQAYAQPIPGQAVPGQPMPGQPYPGYAQATPVGVYPEAPAGYGAPGYPTAAPVGAPTPVATPTAPGEKKPIPMKVILGAVGGLAVIVIGVVVAMILAGGNNGYKRPNTDKVANNGTDKKSNNNTNNSKKVDPVIANAPQGEGASRPAPEPLKPINGKTIEVGSDGNFKEIWEAIAYLRKNRQKYQGASSGGKPNVTINVAPDQAYEAIVIDNQEGDYPPGIHVIVKGDKKAKLKPREKDGLALRLLKTENFKLQNFEIDVAGQEVAADLFGGCSFTTLSKITFTGYSKAGITASALAGRPSNQVLFEECDFRPTQGGTTAIKIDKGLGESTRFLIVEKCRMIGPMASGITIGSPVVNVEIRENIFDRNESPIRFEKCTEAKFLLIANNTFLSTQQAAITFADQLKPTSQQLVFHRNLFSKGGAAELKVEKGFDQTAFDALLAKRGGTGIEHNFSDRKEGANPEAGERELIIEPNNRGKPIAFKNSDPKSPEFCTIAPNSPYSNLPNPSFNTKPYAGAKAPK